MGGGVTQEMPSTTTENQLSAQQKPAVGSLTERSMKRSFWKRVLQTKKLRGDSQKSAYERKYEEADRNIKVNENNEGDRKVSTISVDNSRVPGFMKRMFLTDDGSYSRMDESGSLLKEYSKEYLAILDEEEDEKKEGESLSQDEKAAREKHKRNIERTLVSVSVPNGVNLEDVGRQAIDHAISAAARRTAELIKDKWLAGALKEFHENAPHVIATNDKDGVLSVTTVFGAVEVSGDGSIMPTDEREFRRMRVPWPTRAKSRGRQESGIEVSTVRIQRSNKTLLQGKQLEGWNFSYVNPNGLRIGKTQLYDKIHPVQMSDFFDRAQQYSFRLYAHRGIFMDALSRSVRKNLTAEERALYEKPITIVSTSPSIEEVDLGRIVGRELTWRLANQDDHTPIVVSDIDGHTTDHSEGLRITGINRPDQTGRVDTVRELEVYDGPRKIVYVRQELLDSALNSLAVSQFRQLLINSAQLSDVTPDDLANNKGIIQIIKVGEGYVPPKGAYEITDEKLNQALDYQATIIRGLKEGMVFDVTDLEEVDAELLAVALHLGKRQAHFLVLGTMVKEEREFVESLEKEKADIVHGKTRREIVAKKIATKYLLEVEGWVDERKRVLAEALLNKIAPREIPDFVKDLADVQRELRRLEVNMARTGEGAPTTQERGNLAREYAEVSARRDEIWRGVPPGHRNSLEALMPEGTTPTGEVLDKLSAILEKRRELALQENPDKDAWVEMVYEERELAKQLGISQDRLDRMKSLIRPEKARRMSEVEIMSKLALAQTPEDIVGVMNEVTSTDPALAAVLSLSMRMMDSFYANADAVSAQANQQMHAAAAMARAFGVGRGLRSTNEE